MSTNVRRRALTQWTQTGVQKRYTHRAPSFTYLTQWQKAGVDYAGKIDVGAHMRNSPEMVSQILRVEAAVRMRGLILFVHAMPASSKVLVELYQAFSPNHFPLRSPYAPYFGLEELRQRIPTRRERRARPEFLSVSYALTGNTVPLESAASWGFANYFGKEQYFPMLGHLDDLQNEWEKRSGRKMPLSFFNRGKGLIRQYNRLKVGDFYVLGVPAEKLMDWVYDAKLFYVPTGRDVRSVAAEPTVTAKEGTIGTLMLAQEVLNPSSGLLVVPTDQADRFCQGLNLVDPRKVGLYESILSKGSTEFEAEEKKKREQVDEKLRTFVSDCKNWVENRVAPVPEEETDWTSDDFVEQLP